jgi:CMP-N-acetylneuraminic acid synthetase
VNLIVIPARGGSKGLKDKNLRKLMGRSLISRAILCAKQISSPSRILVSTDSLEIKAEAEHHGAHVPFLRSKLLSGDTATTEDTLKDALQRAESLFCENYEFVIYFSPSEGFLDPFCVNRGIDLLSKDSTLESYFPGRDTFKNFWSQKQSENGLVFERLSESMKIYSSRQQKSPIYREDTGRGLVTRPELWKKNQRIGNRIFIESTSDIRSDLDIHSELDLKIAELVLERIGDYDFLA